MENIAYLLKIIIMYFITAIAVDYSIAIQASVIGAFGESVRFRSRLQNCTGQLIPVNCDIDITYDWQDDSPASGTNTITLTSGSTMVIDTPTSCCLNYIQITNLSGPLCSYSNLIDCGNPFTTTTTTTITTTTSTTTTTTTAAAASYDAPIIKYDQSSSSWGAGANPTWPNIGTGGSQYNLGSGNNSSTTAFGTGNSKYLRLTGGIGQIGPVNDSSTYYYPALTGSFISLYNKSFSYAMVFRIQNFNQYSYISYNYGIDPETRLGVGFNMSSYYDFETKTNKLTADFFGLDSGGPGGSVIIAPTSKWYLVVFTFDKNATYQEAQKFYLNAVKYNFGTLYSWDPSMFFDYTITYNYYQAIAFGTQELDVAAIMCWDNVVLTQAQVQNLYNEYNSRYGLG